MITKSKGGATLSKEIARTGLETAGGRTTTRMEFPIDLSPYRPLALDPAQAELSAGQRKQLEENVRVCRDAIVFFTALGDAKGIGGHTGGPYDIVPEVLIVDGFMRGSDRIVPVYFDEAGHRVALQYLMIVLNGEMEPARLMHYREANARLPGHPERGFTEGVKFSSGRLGHLWPYVNGVALAHPDRVVVLFGSDGSQQEGNDAEAARFAVARRLNVKLIIDDNDVTIAGHPSEYLPGFDLARTLRGHGLVVDEGDGEDLGALYRRVRKALAHDGPVALVNRRKMAPGLEQIEGSAQGHDVVKVATAISYLQARGHERAVAALEAVAKPRDPATYRGSSKGQAKNRDLFGRIVCGILEKMTPEERKARLLAVDSDLEGSCGMHHIRKAFPEIYLNAGVMERGNFSAAAGFGMDPGRQGIFATFSAFLEMIVSEISMARLNESNVLCHFSHAGVDWMADNTCHFGINNFFAANGLAEGDRTRLYFPADQHQMRQVVESIFWDEGMRFVFSTRSGTPDILKPDGAPLFGEGYAFVPGIDEVVREGSAGYVVSYGEVLYRALDAVERLRASGLDVGLLNKPTLNVVDEEALRRVGQTGFVLVVESQNERTGLGIRFGSWLLARGLTPRYNHIGTRRPGGGGLWEQMAHQGLDPEQILEAVRALSSAP